jgi:hypothetical protein
MMYKTVWESEHGEVEVWGEGEKATVVFSRDDSAFPMDMSDFDAMVDAVRKAITADDGH